MLRKIYLLFLTVLTTLPILAQQGAGSIKGTLKDSKTGEALPFANVVAKRNGVVVTGAQTDFDGNYFIKPLDPGQYDVEATFVGYAASRQTGVLVKGDQITFLNLSMKSSTDISEVVITSYKVPLIDKDASGGSGGTVERKDIMKMAGRGGNVAATIGGVNTGAGTGGGTSIRGSRPDGGSFVYIDGVKVRGSTNIPKAALEEVKVITGGLPANYGDVTGGIISYTTRGPSKEFSGSLEAVTSGFKTKTGAAGLDKFGYNLLEGYLTGPIWSKKDADGNKTPLLGFSASLNYTSNVDGAPSAIGYYQLSDAERTKLNNDLLFSPTGKAAVPNSQNLRKDAFNNIKTSTNSGNQTLNGTFRLDVTTTPTISLAFGGSFNYQNALNFNFANTLFNSENNSQGINFDWRAYGKFTQRFKSSEESASSIKNVYYTVMLDYSQTNGITQNANHKKNLFDYGYVGKFDILKDPNQFDTTYEAGRPVFIELNDIPGDTQVIFTPSDKNPMLARYTSEYFSMFEEKAGNYDQLTFIQNRGLRNGDAPNTVYGLWNAPGTPFGQYQKTNNNQVRVSASGSADIGNHAVSVGFEYEQRNDRLLRYNNLVATDRQNNLWQIARSKTNFHLRQLDTTMATVTFNEFGIPVVTYPIKVGSEQTAFDLNLRTALGLDPNGTDYINVDALNPEQLSINYFSADELINNGSNSLVTYFGYDVYGKKLKGKTSLDDFFTKKDQYGQYANNVGAFQPIYFAGYIMDKFAFDDIIFNVGVRVDRFDANQKVLKDKFLFREALTVGDLQGTLNGKQVAVPTGMGNDYTVYVDDAKNPTAILGYRNGSQFYNAEGKVASAKLIKNSSGVIAPLLKNADGGRSTQVEASAFKDYVPQINVMPRISFSFPISDEAIFTAYYNILTRRPVSNNRLDPISYLYINQINSSDNNPVQNPNLKPERTIDYQVGFQQVISKSSSLKIEMFYREIRDQIQTFQNVGAYPQDYYSVDNLDFGTVKGVTLSYDLRQTDNLTMRINYTLQFADGTGSGISGAPVNLQATDFSTLRTIFPLNFDQRHHVNAVVDYRFGNEDYNGPEIGGLKIFKGIGANFIFDLGSGTPYSASSNSNSSRLRGVINGSRLPWQFRSDFQVDKDIPLTFKKADGDIAAKTGNLNVYLTVNNLFNTKNIVNVYNYSGNPDDDGYLQDPRYTNIIENQQNPASYRDLYSLSNFQPNNYSAPRTVRLGVRLDF